MKIEIILDKGRLGNEAIGEYESQNVPMKGEVIHVEVWGLRHFNTKEKYLVKERTWYYLAQDNIEDERTRIVLLVQKLW